MNKEQIQESFEAFATMATNYLTKISFRAYFIIGGWWFIGRFTSG
jgi:hypothetical protein